MGDAMTVKRYHFFDPPIDCLAPSRTRSVYVTEADYLALEQELDQLAVKVKMLRNSLESVEKDAKQMREASYE